MKALFIALITLLSLATPALAYHSQGYSNYNYPPGYWSSDYAYHHFPAQWIGSYNQNSMGWHRYYTNYYKPYHSGSYYGYTNYAYSNRYNRWW